MDQLFAMASWNVAYDKKVKGGMGKQLFISRIGCDGRD